MTRPLARRLWAPFALAAGTSALAPLLCGTSALSADLPLTSGSGMDPHSSLVATRQQLPRLAREQGLPIARLEALPRQHQAGPLPLDALNPPPTPPRSP